ncbi:hypothetical protein FACS1894187_07480 [Synergistales bacterium]|nr:hypothetical protein FACS1894187_07480 [Synergistales bacterium]
MREVRIMVLETTFDEEVAICSFGFFSNHSIFWEGIKNEDRLVTAVCANAN